MSEMLNVFDAEFENTLPVPKSLDGLLNLSWLYQHVENFQKPSPDEQIDLQKKHGTRVPIIAKSSLKLPKSCYALLAVPAVKPKSEVKIEMPTINTPQDYSEVTPSINIVILGHYKSGKSSVLGNIIQSEIGLDDYKLQRESTKAGLENAYLAWAVDELKEERKYFTTVQNSVFSVEKAGKVLNFYDTPGLRDFMSECISATMQADCAVIVMDLSMRKHLQEKVFTPTRDLAYLARSLGLNNVLVFLAKADLVVKNPEKVQEFSGKAQEILKEAGFKEGNIKVLAGSSLEKGVSNEIINFALETPKGLNEEVKPLRLLIDDCFKLVHGKFLGYCICGFILSGIISVGGKIRIDQAGVSGKVKEILKNDIKVKKAMAGDWINFTLTDFEGDFHKLRRSFILTSPDFPTSLYSDLRVRGITNDLKVPLLKKQELIMCIGSIRTQVTVLKILREIIGKSTKNKPRGLKGKTIGDIDIRCHNEVPIEKYKSLQKLGRIVLLHQNQVVFTGMVLEPCN